MKQTMFLRNMMKSELVKILHNARTNRIYTVRNLSIEDTANSLKKIVGKYVQ